MKNALVVASRKNLRDGGDAPRLDALVARVRGEYCEMPGLQLTVAQACRLWQVDVATCEMVLEQLVRDRFLPQDEQRRVCRRAADSTLR